MNLFQILTILFFQKIFKPKLTNFCKKIEEIFFYNRNFNFVFIQEFIKINFNFNSGFIL
jgi:hypothetical protein